MMQAQIYENMAPHAKGKALETLTPDQDTQERWVFHALLYPNRSLPQAGFYGIIALVIIVNVFTAIYATVLGGWPVIFFAVLDVIIVWLAFKISYRQGRLHERILLDENTLWISRVLPSGHEMRWQLQPYWTRVSFDKPLRHESQLRLVSKGQTLILGAFLSPEERQNLAEALQTAIIKALQKEGVCKQASPS